MKMLHIVINEFETVEEALQSIVPNSKSANILAPDRDTAEVLLNKIPYSARVFWAETCKEYNKIILHETIID